LAAQSSPGSALDSLVSGSLNAPAGYVFTSNGENRAPTWQAGQPESINTVTAAGASQTLSDPRIKSINDLTLSSGSCALTFPTATAGLSFTLVLRQDGSGSRVVTWPGTVKWAGGSAPTLTTTASAVDTLSFLCVDGTNWFGYVLGKDMK